MCKRQCVCACVLPAIVPVYACVRARVRVREIVCVYEREKGSVFVCAYAVIWFFKTFILFTFMLFSLYTHANRRTDGQTD